MRDMTPLTLDDFDAAPFRFVASAVFPCTADRLFAELAEPERWTHWFPLMHRARWTSTESAFGERPPRQKSPQANFCESSLETAKVGARREVSILGFGRFEETILAFDPGARFAFTMIASTSPLASQMGEDYRVTSVEGGARLDWTLVARPTRIGKIVEGALPLVLRTIWRGAEVRLRRRVRA